MPRRPSLALAAGALALQGGSAYSVAPASPGPRACARAGSPRLSAAPAGGSAAGSSAAPAQGGPQAASQARRTERGAPSGWAPELPLSAPAWGTDSLARGALALLASASLLGVAPAFAEDELALLAADKSTSELVDTACFAKSCKLQTEACAADGDCIKGLACTAKCMGDSKCTVGCFARYDNKILDDVLSCTIEDAGCIKIATQEPGPDSALDAPPAPKALVRATPASMSGRWYKVLGFNPNYDCYDCQRNSFATSGGGARPSGSEVALDIGPNSAAVEVEYAMPRIRVDQPPETFRATLNEKLEFDDTPGSRRTAHTEGKMFGLTFWENWYLIGENQQQETPFKFVYYTGKTLQNRYEGAFVYARKPELPASAMPSIYKIAREAGLDPTKACCIDNKCFEPAGGSAVNAPPFTPVASAEMLPDPKPSAGATMPWSKAVRDVQELIEDPRPAAEAIFGKQRQMFEVREFDANGYKLPSNEYGN